MNFDEIAKKERERDLVICDRLISLIKELPNEGWGSNSFISCCCMWLGREFVCRLAKKAVIASVNHDNWDGIQAWGGMLSFRACWWDRNRYEDKAPYMCFWELIYPGVEEWSKQVFSGDEIRGWIGWFSTAGLPRTASLLSFPIQ